MKKKQLENKYRELAQEKHVSDEGNIEVDDCAVVSIGEAGAYVQAWTFIRKSQIKTVKTFKR